MSLKSSSIAVLLNVPSIAVFLKGNSVVVMDVQLVHFDL